MAYDTHQLLKMSKSDLDALFAKSPAGPIPNGEAKGLAIVAPGSGFSGEIAAIINHFGWQGKTFDARHGTLRNRITAFGINAIIAQVYAGNSLLDGKPCIVLDYSQTSLVAERVRDEIRQVAPNVYLGQVFWEKKATIHFALDFSS
jgi:glutaredoxin-related protein